MRCRKVKKKLSAFIDNELKQEIKSDVERHLAECSFCNQELMLLNQTWDALEVFEKIDTSDSFEARYWKKVREKELRQPSFQRLLKITIPASAIALVILAVGLSGGIYLGNMLFSKETEAPPENSLSVMKENLLYLENFEDLPPESVGSIYVALTSQNK